MDAAPSRLPAPILIVGACGPEDILWGVNANVRFALNDLADLGVWNGLGCPIPFHVDIDTGMGRLGIASSET